jgi:hypothetical protein
LPQNCKIIFLNQTNFLVIGVSSLMLLHLNV